MNKLIFTILLITIVATQTITYEEIMSDEYLLTLITEKGE